MSTVDEREREREREREKPLCRTMTSLCEPQLGKVVLSFFRDGQRFQQSASEAARGRGRWGRGGVVVDSFSQLLPGVAQNRRISNATESLEDHFTINIHGYRSSI